VSGEAHSLRLQGYCDGHRVQEVLNLCPGSWLGTDRSLAPALDKHPHKEPRGDRRREAHEERRQERSVVRRSTRIVEQESVARCCHSERNAGCRNVSGCATQWHHQDVPESQSPDARQRWPQDVWAASPRKADKHREPSEQEGCADAEQTHDAEQKQTNRQRSVSPGCPHVFIVRRTGTGLRSTNSTSCARRTPTAQEYCDGHLPRNCHRPQTAVVAGDDD
jgi:hypothetical protein